MATQRKRTGLLGACLVALLPLLVMSASCSLFSSDLPDNACETNADCFRAQGEVCHRDLGECGPPGDAMPPPDADLTPDARPRPDATPPPDADLNPDADVVDAGAPDATTGAAL